MMTEVPISNQNAENPRGGLPNDFNLTEQIEAGQQSIGAFEMPKAVEAANRVMGDHKKQVEELDYQATHDGLTGLLNKAAWRKRAEEFINSSDEVAVIFIDLTNFKAINDHAPGRHETGDEILKQVAKKITGSLREDDRQLASHERLIQPQESEAGRYGGDEFALVIDLKQRDSGGGKPMSLKERMNVVIDRLQTDFADLKEDNADLVADHKFDLAIGGAVKQPGMETSQLVIAADYAMEKNKAAQHAKNGSYR